jgi:hypothetical protein
MGRTVLLQGVHFAVYATSPFRHLADSGECNRANSASERAWEAPEATADVGCRVGQAFSTFDKFAKTAQLLCI